MRSRQACCRAQLWGPTIIEGLGVRSNLAIGWLSAVPNIAAVICLIAVGRHSDRTLERRYHSALLCLVAAGGLTMIGLFTNHPLYAFLGLVLGTMGGVSAIAPFWQFPPMLLAGRRLPEGSRSSTRLAVSQAGSLPSPSDGSGTRPVRHQRVSMLWRDSKSLRLS